MRSKKLRGTRRNRSGNGNEQLNEKGSGLNHRLTSAGIKPTFGVLLGIICLVALFLRAFSILQTVETPTTIRLLGDAKGYYDWANRIASGQWYGNETFYQAPLYPYFLACQIKFLGSSIIGLRLFQAVLGAISVAALGIAGRDFFRPKVGLLAAGLYAFYPPAIYFDGIIQKTSLASFLLCLLLALAGWAYRCRREPTKAPQQIGLATSIGLVLALLMLTRENSILWVPIFPIWFWLISRQSRVGQMQSVMGYAIGLALILLPVAARNASLGGEWSPTTFQAGPNFYIGNHLESNGVYQPLIQGHETPMYERADAQRLAEEATGRPMSSREVSRYWFSKTWSEIIAAPTSWLELMAIKSLMVFNRFEVPDVECFYIYQEDSWPLKILGPWWHFGILCPLALWGILATDFKEREIWILHALLLVMIGAIILFFILGRYRQPLVPITALFAGAGVIDLFRRIRLKQCQRVRVAALATFASLLICNLPIHDESMLRASSYMNMGIAAGQAGNLDVSIPALQKAIKKHPEMVEAYVNLGHAMEMSNRSDNAIACYEAALKIDPDLIMVDAALGLAYAKRGNLQQAIFHYERAIQIDPQDEQSRVALNTLLTMPKP